MTRGPDKQFDREEVLGKAMELFWENGYEATGMAQLIEHMGIGRQSLYNTFGDKKALYVEALAAYFTNVAGPMVKILNGPGSALENLRTVFGHWENMISDRDYAGCLAGNTMAEMAHSDPEIAAVLGGYMKSMETAIRRTVERGQESGDITCDLPAGDIARMLMTVAQGVALASKVTKDRASARAVLATTLALLEAPCLTPALEH